MRDTRRVIGLGAGGGMCMIGGVHQASTEKAAACGDVVEPLGGRERSRAVAEALAAHDEDLLGRLVEERPLPPERELEARLAGRVARAQVHPVLFGGTLAARRRVTLYRRDADGGTRARPVRLTRLEVVGDPGAPVLTAGHIARVHGMPDLRVGDRLGPPAALHHPQRGLRHCPDSTAPREPRPARPGLETLARRCGRWPTGTR